MTRKPIDSRPAPGGRRLPLRAALIPLSLYLAMTLAVPAARGALAEPGFWTHAVQVVAVTAAIFAAFAAVAVARRGAHRDGARGGPKSARRPVRSIHRPTKGSSTSTKRDRFGGRSGSPIGGHGGGGASQPPSAPHI